VAGCDRKPGVQVLEDLQVRAEVIIQPEEGRLAFMPTELSDLVQDSTLYY
jgi:hypothetical protein